MARRNLDEWLWQVGAELQRLSQEATSSTPMISQRLTWEPRVDVFESEEGVALRFEIAGVREEDIRLVYDPAVHALILRGVRREERHPGPKMRPHQLEIFIGEFQREIALPDIPLDIEQAEARYYQGFLTVLLPRTETRSGLVIRQTITIQRY